MTDKKQIEEMAKVLKDYTKENHIMASHTILENYAEALYNAGYRKQEWISVDERLPELEDVRNWGNHRPRSIRVLCVCQQRSGKVFVKEGYYELFSNRHCWRIPGSIDSVTHWMPLPSAPKENDYAEIH